MQSSEFKCRKQPHCVYIILKTINKFQVSLLQIEHYTKHNLIVHVL